MTRGEWLAYLAGVTTPALIGVLAALTRVALHRRTGWGYVYDCPACGAAVASRHRFPLLPGVIGRPIAVALARRGHWHHWTTLARAGDPSTIAQRHLPAVERAA